MVGGGLKAVFAVPAGLNQIIQSLYEFGPIHSHDYPPFIFAQLRCQRADPQLLLMHILQSTGPPRLRAWESWGQIPLAKSMQHKLWR